MTKYFCDKCKEETAITFLHKLSIDLPFDMSVGSQKKQNVELCNKCTDKLHIFLKHE